MAMMRSIARDMLRGVVAEVGDAKQDTTDLAVALSKVREECRQQQALNRALNEQLAAVGEELAAARGQYESERARSTALHDQLVAVGKELEQARALPSQSSAHDAGLLAKLGAILMRREPATPE